MVVKLTDKDKAFLTDLKEVLDKHNASVEAYSDENMDGAYLNFNFSNEAMNKMIGEIDSHEIQIMLDKGYYVDYFNY